VGGSRTLALLFGHRLVGQVLGILLLECIEKLRMLVGYCVAERLSMPIYIRGERKFISAKQC